MHKHEFSKDDLNRSNMSYKSYIDRASVKSF